MESEKLALSLELADQERLLKTANTRIESIQQDRDKQQLETTKLKNNIDEELRALSSKEEELKRKIASAEEDERKFRDDCLNKKTELERIRDDRREIGRVWERMKQQAEVLNKKKEELIAMLQEQKQLSENADRVRAITQAKQEGFETQKRELEEHFTLRVQYLKDENKRKIQSIKNTKELQITEKQRSLAELKSQLESLNSQEKDLQNSLLSVREEKSRAELLWTQRDNKQREIQELTEKLAQLEKASRMKEDKIEMMNDPRLDISRIGAEIIKLDGKRIDLSSTKTRLSSEVGALERESRELEAQVAQKKDELFKTAQQRQTSSQNVQSQLSAQIARCRQEQAELKGKINQLLEQNDLEHEQSKQALRQKESHYQNILNEKVRMVEQLKDRVFGRLPGH